MALASCHEYWDEDLDLGLPDDCRARRTFLAITTTRYTRGAAVIAAARMLGTIPNLFDAHPDDASLTCRKVKAKRDGTALKWMIDVDYSSDPAGQKESDKVKALESNPLDRKAKIRRSTNHYKKAVYKDKNGDGILNAAGDYFDPPVELDTKCWTFHITRNVLDVPNWVYDIDEDGFGPLNQDTWTILGKDFPAQTLKVEHIEVGELQEENGVEFYEMQVVLEYKRDTWKLKLLNQGLYEFSGTGVHRRCVDGNGKPVVAPVLLSEVGTQLFNPAPADAVFLEFDVAALLPFTSFVSLLT